MQKDRRPERGGDLFLSGKKSNPSEECFSFACTARKEGKEEKKQFEFRKDPFAGFPAGRTKAKGDA